LSLIVEINNMEKWDLLVVGGGAAGFFCAVNAARLHPDLKVALIEKSGKLLSKVSVSGGGRCNVTHACYDIDAMVRHYPRGGNFLRKAFHHFFTTDTIAWFRERGVELHTEADGRMFPVSNQSSTIVQCLLQEAAKYNVSIFLNQDLEELKPLEGEWELRTASGRTYRTSRVCLAMGGLNRPSMTSLFQHLSHTLVPSVPSLFTFNMPGNSITRLMGIAVEQVRAKVPGTKLESEGPLLITHWGMSGPAILKLSAWGARILAEKNYHFNVQINWIPEHNENSLREFFDTWRAQAGKQLVYNKNPFGLPQRLWEYLLQEQAHVAPNKRWADLSSKEWQALVKALLFSSFEVKGKTTFKEEFVTAGGVSLSEIDHQTMESRKHPGLFFAGEVMDVDGITGGFNFQHAWTSGFLAAANVNRES
jgi:predicted Rossmann fold flavoprotein